MATSVTTRIAAPADLAACAALHIASCLDIYRGFIPDEMHSTVLPQNLRSIWAAETLPGGDFILIAEDAGDIVGLVTVRAGEPAYIDHFHVRPDRKGQGIGRVLMQALVPEMLHRGMTAMYLDYAEGNDGAKAFYAAMGGEIGEAVEGDLFGIPLPARSVRWHDLRHVRPVPA